MKLSEQEAEQFRNDARASRHFMAKLHNLGAKLVLADTPESRAEEQRILTSVIAPLVRASKQVLLYDSDCLAEEWPEPGRERLRHIAKASRGSTVKLDLAQGDIIDGLTQFWAGGWTSTAGSRSLKRGIVLFFIDDAKLPMSEVFSQCTWAGVLSNQRSALGASAFARAQRDVRKGPSHSAIALSDRGTLSRITIFAEGALLGRYIEQILRHAKWYDH
ncbi:MAG TPA: hypothetical protein VGD52_20510 [Pseudoduganella sp.]